MGKELEDTRKQLHITRSAYMAEKQQHDKTLELLSEVEIVLSDLAVRLHLYQCPACRETMRLQQTEGEG